MPRLAIWLVGLSLLGLAEAAGANRDAAGEYWLSPQEGPWMIYIASFRGDADHEDPTLRPRDMARRLVHELRSDYKLAAYMFNRSEEEKQKELKRREDWHKRYGDAPLRKIRIPDEYAVLVGNFKDMDAARKALEKLKKQPAPKSVPGQKAAIGKIGGDRNNGIFGRARTEQVAEMNALAASWVCRNPLAPRAPEMEEEKFDPFLSKLNDGQPYNLLKNRKPWTLAVKVYEGATVIQSNKKPSVFDSPGSSKNPVMDRQLQLFMKSAGKDLDNAAALANNLAGILRHKDLAYESYVLHTRNNSIVSIGSFDSPNDPRLLQLQQQLAGMKVGHVDLMPQPAPMPVPRK